MTQDVVLLWPLSALGIHTGTNLGKRSLLLRKACTQDSLFTVEKKVSDFFVYVGLSCNLKEACKFRHFKCEDGIFFDHFETLN